MERKTLLLVIIVTGILTNPCTPMPVTLGSLTTVTAHSSSLIETLTTPTTETPTKPPTKILACQNFDGLTTATNLEDPLKITLEVSLELSTVPKPPSLPFTKPPTNGSESETSVQIVTTPTPHSTIKLLVLTPESSTANSVAEITTDSIGSVQTASTVVTTDAKELTGHEDACATKGLNESHTKASLTSEPMSQHGTMSKTNLASGLTSPNTLAMTTDTFLLKLLERTSSVSMVQSETLLPTITYVVSPSPNTDKLTPVIIRTTALTQTAVPSASIIAKYDISEKLSTPSVSIHTMVLPESSSTTSGTMNENVSETTVTGASVGPEKDLTLEYLKTDANSITQSTHEKLSPSAHTVPVKTSAPITPPPATSSGTIAHHQKLSFSPSQFALSMTSESAYIPNTKQTTQIPCENTMETFTQMSEMTLPVSKKPLAIPGKTTGKTLNPTFPSFTGTTVNTFNTQEGILPTSEKMTTASFSIYLTTTTDTVKPMQSESQLASSALPTNVFGKDVSVTQTTTVSIISKATVRRITQPKNVSKRTTSSTNKTKTTTKKRFILLPTPTTSNSHAYVAVTLVCLLVVLVVVTTVIFFDQNPYRGSYNMA